MQLLHPPGIALPQTLKRPGKSHIFIYIFRPDTLCGTEENIDKYMAIPGLHTPCCKAS